MDAGKIPIPLPSTFDTHVEKGECHETQRANPPFSALTIMTMATILMATWEALSTTMVSGLESGGPTSLVYGFLFALCGATATAASLGELMSMWPTAGGQYHFIAKLAPNNCRYFLSWVTGWTSTFGWVAFTASAPFLAATMIQGIITLDDPSYDPQRWHGTFIYWGLLVISMGINVWSPRMITLVETFSLLIHVLGFFVLFIVMWVVAPERHTASFVFTTFQNNSGWSNDGVAWFIGMLSSCYVLTGYDGAIHLCEGMKTPEIAVPWCMLGSLAINGALGFAFLMGILFCMGDMTTALTTPTGFPIIEIFNYITSSTAAGTAMTCVLVTVAGISTIPLMASSSRMLACLARDKAFPFSSKLSKVDYKTDIPRPAVIVLTGFLAILGFVNIGSTTAFNAIISLAVFALQSSYLIPIAFMVWRRLFYPQMLTYGPWSLGRVGFLINLASLIYLISTCIWLLFPPYQPVTAVNMNYACLIFGAVLIFSFVYWFWKGRRQYEGPIMQRSNITE